MSAASQDFFCTCLPWVKSLAVEQWMCCSDVVNLVGSGYKNIVFVREQVEPVLHLMCFNRLENPLSISSNLALLVL